jgi:hypothetical protein
MVKQLLIKDLHILCLSMKAPKKAAPFQLVISVGMGRLEKSLEKGSF